MTAVAATLFLSTLGWPALGLADTKSDAQTAADRWDQAYNSGDMEGLGKLYTPDATVIPKGAPVNGAGIQSFFAGLKAKGFDSHKTTVNAATPKDNLMVLTGRWSMTGPGEGGAKKTFEGNWVNVMERQGNEWRTVLHTWN
ncbi:nuclear transport factor 2 family protein [Methylobacterium planeticum]|uniref:Nuclear transport factor 2 family protein n=2 Tax=Methylobacterium planeticum TaxID=2615211 RepID=A0A6N6MKT9_9HYPH|nr:nuclear transport factor 2 family protein [Methylobacterium planeticum]